MQPIGVVVTMWVLRGYFSETRVSPPSRHPGQSARAGPLWGDPMHTRQQENAA